jgi:transketolase
MVSTRCRSDLPSRSSFHTTRVSPGRSWSRSWTRAGRSARAVEAGSTALWHQWVGTLGGVVGIDHYGASAPGGTLLARFGFTEDNVVEQALAVLHREHIEKARMLRNLSA